MPEPHESSKIRVRIGQHRRSPTTSRSCEPWPADRHWQIALYQNTPAQFHGRPDLVKQLTADLEARLREA